jgi:hypothetical protein
MPLPAPVISAVLPSKRFELAIVGISYDDFAMTNETATS